MRIIVTGAGGFVGQRLVTQLVDHEVVALDRTADDIPRLPHIKKVAGDLCDVGLLESAFAGGCDAVVHLATVPGGAAEQNKDLARRVNIDATMALADTAAQTGKRPRFVFASSIAVFGDPFPAQVNDATPLAPKMLYGAHKAMMEQWLATMTRRNALDAISLRLAGVVARPRGPSGMKSAFLSDVFHAVAAGEPFVMPVSAAATCWLSSLDCAAGNIAHALTADLAQAPPARALTLPNVRVRIANLVAEISEQSGRSVDCVSYAPDDALEAAFGVQPPITTKSADALGFIGDKDVAMLVRRTLRQFR